MAASDLSLADLAARLHRLERRHRRLRWTAGCLIAALTLGLVGIHLKSFFDHTRPAFTTQHLNLFAGDVDASALSGFSIDPTHLRGGIGLNHDQKHAGLLFLGAGEQVVHLGTDDFGPSLQLMDSTSRVVLGPQHQGAAMLEFASADGRYALRLGLDVETGPVFEVARDGVTTSLLTP